MQINHHSWKEHTKMSKVCFRNVAKCRKALRSLQILYNFVLRAEIAISIFGPNVVAISARNFTTFRNQTLQFYSF
jgi:hypothetical protein